MIFYAIISLAVLPLATAYAISECVADKVKFSGVDAVGILLSSLFWPVVYGIAINALIEDAQRYRALRRTNQLND